MSSIVITGVGLTTPLGCSYETFWKNAISSQSVIQHEKLFSNSEEIQLISRVNNTYMQHALSPRHLRKVDRFVIMAIAAIKQSIEDANLPINEGTNEKIGLLIGNSFGGIDYIENQVAQYYRGDTNAINSYVATAWFPTSVQGEASIAFNIRGYSKILSAGTLSAGFAFEHAVDLLNDGKLDHVIVGGTEAPLTPLAYNACVENQIIVHGESALCEGSAMFVLEKNTTAHARGSKIYAEFSGIGIGQNLIESMSACLKNAGKSIDQIDVILLNASGRQEHDQTELDQTNTFFGNNKRCYVNSIKQLYGNAVSANMAIDFALACSILDKQSLPPAKIKLAADYIQKGFSVTQKETSANIQNILINSINCYGECLTLMLSEPRH